MFLHITVVYLTLSVSVVSDFIFLGLLLLIFLIFKQFAIINFLNDPNNLTEHNEAANTTKTSGINCCRCWNTLIKKANKNWYKYVIEIKIWKKFKLKSIGGFYLKGYYEHNIVYPISLGEWKGIYHFFCSNITQIKNF